jgi:hypothetical protein
MKNLVLLSILFLGACTSAIKDEKSQKEEPASEGVELKGEFRPDPNGNFIVNEREDLIGYWVGWFKPDLTKAQRQKLSEQEYYPSRNKVNISIDRFQGDSVYGHSVVANNNRPFKGIMMTSGMSYSFDVVEPGDDKHDGAFEFKITKGDSNINGTWQAYDSTLKISKRGYKLAKSIYQYDPNFALVDWFTDESKQPQIDSLDLVNMLDGRSWEETLEGNYLYDSADVEGMSQEEKLDNLYEMLSDWGSEGEFYSVTEMFNEYNASVDTLTSEFVSELSKADIYILRNSIFARHGYSFKKKDLRSYFDRQEWYIPVHADIKADLTDIEKQNIKVLLAYEEHAEEYYDYFGR